MAVSGAELELRRDRRQPEVDDEDRDEDRQAAEDLDVEPDQRCERQNWIVSSVPSTTPISVLPTTATAEIRSVVRQAALRM